MDIMLRLFLYHPIPFLIIAIIVIDPMESQADTEIEIKHIIEYIESSNCTFIRNGKEYNTKEALEHILNKYEYTKRWIK
jgi:hypothetical protein